MVNRRATGRVLLGLPSSSPLSCGETRCTGLRKPLRRNGLSGAMAIFFGIIQSPSLGARLDASTGRGRGVRALESGGPADGFTR